MRIEENKRLEIIKLVETLPVDEQVRINWVSQLQKEDVPKELLFDIMATLEASSNVDPAELDAIRAKITNYYGEIHQEIKQNEALIDESIAEIEAGLKKIEEDASGHTPAGGTTISANTAGTLPGEQGQNAPINPAPSSQNVHTRTDYPQAPSQQNQPTPPVSNEYY